MNDIAANHQRAAFRANVADRFGVLPNFFCSASAAPGLIERLWGFAQSAYLDSPLPSLFKERLFVHLSRFCPVRYCIVALLLPERKASVRARKEASGCRRTGSPRPCDSGAPAGASARRQPSGLGTSRQNPWLLHASPPPRRLSDRRRPTGGRRDSHCRDRRRVLSLLQRPVPDSASFDRAVSCLLDHPVPEEIPASAMPFEYELFDVGGHAGKKR
jgi:hypothetical protein